MERRKRGEVRAFLALSPCFRWSLWQWFISIFPAPPALSLPLWLQFPSVAWAVPTPPLLCVPPALELVAASWCCKSLDFLTFPFVFSAFQLSNTFVTNPLALFSSMYPDWCTDITRRVFLGPKEMHVLNKVYIMQWEFVLQPACKDAWQNIFSWTLCFWDLLFSVISVSFKVFLQFAFLLLG